jgi:uncharacterized protein YhdP
MSTQRNRADIWLKAIGHLRRIGAIIALLPATLLQIEAAQAQSNASALVEEIDDGVPHVIAFDTLKPGQSVDLRPSHHAVISYLDSCIRETISGGLIKIGTSQSDVQDGNVQRDKVECSLKQLSLTEATQDQSATTVFRPLFDNLVKQTLPDVSPFILGQGLAKVELKQMGKEEAPIILTLQQGKIDLRSAGIKLRPGSIYKISNGTRETYIKIAPEATAGQAQLLARVVTL